MLMGQVQKVGQVSSSHLLMRSKNHKNFSLNSHSKISSSTIKA